MWSCHFERVLGLLLLLSVGACDGPKLPRFARPLPYDAGLPDAQVADEDGGGPLAAEARVTLVLADGRTVGGVEVALDRFGVAHGEIPIPSNVGAQAATLKLPTPSSAEASSTCT